MALKAGKPTTLKTQKELAIAAVQDQDTETAEKIKKAVEIKKSEILFPRIAI